MEMDKSSWPRCLLWHGWLPLLSGVNGGSPWTEGHAESAVHRPECALGSYDSGLLTEWHSPVGFDAEGAAGHVLEEPDVWTDGSLVRIMSRVLVLLVLFFFSSPWSSLG